MLRWTVHVKGGPKRQYSAAAAAGHEVYSFGGDYGGENCGTVTDVQVFNTVSLRWARPPAAGMGECPLEAFAMRWGHTAVLIEHLIYIWGGRTDKLEYYDVVHAFDVDAHRWFKPTISGTVPGARSHHSACVLVKVMYIYGGYTQLIGRTNDIHKLDTGTMVWSSINTRGTLAVPSCEHSATVIGTKMFVFGGHNYNYDYDNNNIRVFDTETNCWLSTPSVQFHPEGRCCHSAFAYNGELYIFGGHNMSRTFNDMWKFNSDTLIWTKVEPKGKGLCWTSRMCCCMVGDRISLFGGYAADDLYMLDLCPSLKTLCKLAAIHYGLEQAGLPHDIRWELAAMTTNSKGKE